IGGALLKSDDFVLGAKDLAAASERDQRVDGLLGAEFLEHLEVRIFRVQDRVTLRARDAQGMPSRADRQRRAAAWTVQTGNGRIRSGATQRVELAKVFEFQAVEVNGSSEEQQGRIIAVIDGCETAVLGLQVGESCVFLVPVLEWKLTFHAAIVRTSHGGDVIGCPVPIEFPAAVDLTRAGQSFWRWTQE